MLCLLFFFSLALGNFPPFTSDELPSDRVINIWKPTGGERLYFPIHFGPTGTQAWESVFITTNFFACLKFGIIDCFCGGDQFRLQISTSNLNGEPNIVDVIPNVSSYDCEHYSDSVEACLQDSNYYAFYSARSNFSSELFFNITISTLQSPYGGGVLYFWYQSNDD